MHAGALFDKTKSSPQISGDLKVAQYCASKNPALMAETFSGRGMLSSGGIWCMYGNFTFSPVTV
jgi:hypothetical protein